MGGEFFARRVDKRGWVILGRASTIPGGLSPGGCGLATLGDFYQRTYQLACPFVRFLRYVNSYIERLCACCRALNTNKITV
ncbi:MAG: hypothetical protein KJO08_00865, partial [Gammaproteobacteria bacterium]|nr:hypothetical protein [Gammaproteobacteria bacterium]